MWTYKSSFLFFGESGGRLSEAFVETTVAVFAERERNISIHTLSAVNSNLHAII
jgi:hypothetical protein